MAYSDASRIGEMPQDEEQFDRTIGGVNVSRRGNSAVVDFNPGASRMSADDSDEHSANIMDDLSEFAMDVPGHHDFFELGAGITYFFPEYLLN